MFNRELRILVDIVDNPALAFGHGLFAKLFLCELIAPVAKPAFCKLLNVSLVDERDTFAFMCERILNRTPHQALGSRCRNGLDANARIPANLLLCVFQHVFVQKFEQLFRFGRPGLPLDPDIDVLGVLAKNKDIQLFRMLHGRGNSFEVANWTLARIKVQNLSQRHVQRTNAAADWSR